MKRLCLLLCLCVTSIHAATIYKHIAPDGTIVFTDKELKGEAQQKIIVADKNHPEQSKLARHLKNKIRQEKPNLDLQISEAKDALKDSLLLLKLMRERDARAYQTCLKKKAALEKQKHADRFYVCQHASMAQYEKDVEKAKQQLKELR